MSANQEDGRRLIIASNRLPVVLARDGDGSWRVTPGSGGLVTALAPVLRNRGGVWIGWNGVVQEDGGDDRDLLTSLSGTAGYTLEPVPLSAEERDDHYCGFSNEIIWPLFHDLVYHANFEPRYWRAHVAVNRKFAAAIAQQPGGDRFIWVHDYHLMLVAQELRAMGVSDRIGFFLHIPFPPLDIYQKLPWRNEILRALLNYDLVGFQTQRDRRNFANCVQALRPGVRITGKGQVVSARIEDREVRLGTFPIGIDFNEFAGKAGTREVADAAWYVHENLPNRQLILGVDRLDYSKGIPDRLKAYANFLERHPEMHGKVSFIQVVVPSRMEVGRYAALRDEIEQLIGHINGRFTSSGWVPIHYTFRSLDRTELLGYYRSCEVALITPLKDGMNLVAKEYCASSVEEECVLILSESAGAAAQLRVGALLVNPHDLERVADAIHQALTMPTEERRERMRKLRRVVRERDVFWWVDLFLRAAFATDLSGFPLLDEQGPGIPEAPEASVEPMPPGKREA